jgi:tRNA(fMet)-specific endonuclease VapC
MNYMLDTNICIYLIKRKPIQVINRLESLQISKVCLSSVTAAELEYGIEKSQHVEQNRLALLEFIAALDILPFDYDAARWYGTVRCKLEKAGKPIGALDMMIAAHALSRGIILVTNNLNEFQKVEGLKVENWA